MDGSYFPIFGEHLASIAKSLERIEGHLAVLAEHISEEDRQARLGIEARYRRLKQALAARKLAARKLERDEGGDTESLYEVEDYGRQIRELEAAHPLLTQPAGMAR